MTLTKKKMFKKWKSDSAIQLGESCRSDILSDIEGFKKPVLDSAIQLGESCGSDILSDIEGFKQPVSDSAIQLGVSCRSDILSDIKGFKKPVLDSAIQLGEPCGSDILSDIEGFKQPVEECALLRFQPNNQGREKKEHLILQIETDAPPTQGVAAQNSCSNSRPLRECESGSGIMFYAVLIILVVAEAILFTHLVFF